MDPDSNKFVRLSQTSTDPAGDAQEEIAQELLRMQAQMLKQGGTPDPAALSTLVLPDGKPIPSHWAVFTVGEQVVVKGYTFRVAYIGESTLLLEPVGPYVVGGGG